MAQGMSEEEALEEGQRLRNAALAEVRASHRDDLQAQRLIDQYDPSSEYRQKHKALVEAVLDHDEDVERELIAWFMQNYPDAAPR